MLRDRILDYLKMRLHAASQFPSVELLYDHGGIGAITNYLKQCGSRTITGDTLRRFGAKVHPDCLSIGPWLTMHEVPADYSNLEVGAHCYVGQEVFLDLTEKIVIEDGAGLGMRSLILTHRNFDPHPSRPIASMVPKIAKPTIIRRGAAHVTILAGVTIGEHSVIGAGCVITEDVPPFTLVKSPTPADTYRFPDSIVRKMMTRSADSVAEDQSSAA